MYHTIIPFPRGQILLVKSDKGLSFAEIIKDPRQIENVAEFLRKKALPFERNDQEFKLEKKLFEKYFNGKKEDFTSLPIDLILGTPYQKRVWREARKIPYGKTKSYKSLAEKLNHKGFRSVGQAMGKNPLIIVIPCHRVLRSDGSLGGFGAGLDIKEYLLRLEKEEIPS